MINNRQLFFNILAQTSSKPLAIEIIKAEGCKIFDSDGKEYIDLISGISVSNVGHRHPEIIKAIKEQLEAYLHVMVYGELILSPQIKFAEAIKNLLPSSLSNIYFVNSGSEANEGAIKLAKKYTGRYHTISFKNSYHGSTQGALTVMGSDYFKDIFRPLIPGHKVLSFNNIEELNKIDSSVACVIVEPVQGEAGVIAAKKDFLKALRLRCKEVGALLIFDEVQTGFGRTGKLFGFEHYDIIPDIITIAKAMGGGMPLGAFITSKEIMSSFANNPELSHITTFGGHPVSCAAALASLEVIIRENLIEQVIQKEEFFVKGLKDIKGVKDVRSKGLFIAVEFETYEIVYKIMIESLINGLMVDTFLFASNCIRIAPPLNICYDLIYESLEKFRKSVKRVLG